MPSNASHLNSSLILTKPKNVKLSMLLPYANTKTLPDFLVYSSTFLFIIDGENNLLSLLLLFKMFLHLGKITSIAPLIKIVPSSKVILLYFLALSNSSLLIIFAFMLLLIVIYSSMALSVEFPPITLVSLIILALL